MGAKPIVIIKYPAHRSYSKESIDEMMFDIVNRFEGWGFIAVPTQQPEFEFEVLYPTPAPKCQIDNGYQLKDIELKTVELSEAEKESIRIHFEEKFNHGL